MTAFLAEVQVMLKPSVNDPQGLSVLDGLRALGFAVDDVRVGKLIRITLEAPDRETAATRVREMGDKLLANPVIETFELSVSEQPAPVP